MPSLWIDTGISLSASDTVQVQVSLMTGVSSTQTRFDRMTLVRTIIGFDLGNLVHDSGEGSQLVSIGIGIASQEAFAIAGGLPDPQIDTDFPTRGWVWRARYRTFGFAADQPTIFTRRIDLDIRAQRKLENGESYLSMHNADVEGVSSTVRLTGLVRQLWSVG